MNKHITISTALTIPTAALSFIASRIFYAELTASHSAFARERAKPGIGVMIIMLSTVAQLLVIFEDDDTKDMSMLKASYSLILAVLSTALGVLSADYWRSRK